MIFLGGKDGEMIERSVAKIGALRTWKGRQKIRGTFLLPCINSGEVGRPTTTTISLMARAGGPKSFFGRGGEEEGDSGASIWVGLQRIWEGGNAVGREFDKDSTLLPDVSIVHEKGNQVLGNAWRKYGCESRNCVQLFCILCDALSPRLKRLGTGERTPRGVLRDRGGRTFLSPLPFDRRYFYWISEEARGIPPPFHFLLQKFHPLPLLLSEEKEEPFSKLGQKNSQNSGWKTPLPTSDLRNRYNSDPTTTTTTFALSPHPTDEELPLLQPSS